VGRAREGRASPSAFSMGGGDGGRGVGSGKLIGQTAWARGSGFGGSSPAPGAIEGGSLAPSNQATCRACKDKKAEQGGSGEARRGP